MQPYAKILIVDDTPQNLALLQESLEPEGYDLYIATSGERALDILTQVKPDLILLDIMMDGMDGFETFEKIKAQPALASVPVIFLSALNDTQSKIKAFKMGGIDYITKPFNHLEVLARVNTHLQRNRMFHAMERLIKKAFHEVYTPLGIINTAVEMQTLEHGQSDYMFSIQAAARSLQNVYEDIYFAMKKEVADYPVATVPLPEFLRSRIHYFMPLAKAKEITISLQAQSGSVRISETELQRLVDNTLSNAIKFGNAGSTISVEVIDADAPLKLKIANEGRTINDIKAVFTELYREDENRIGLGLGLDIVKMICDHYNIAIDVTSENDLTTFTYTFGSEG